MSRNLPILRKFLLAAATCAAVLLSAQQYAIAQAPAGTSVPAGAFVVRQSDATWRDAVRERDVPVRVYVPAVPEGPPAPTATGTRFPVILFSHGLGGSREGGKLWAAHWASHGYVVVAMQHPGSDESLWKDSEPRDVSRNLKSGMTLKNLNLRVGDVRFVIDEVIRRAAEADAAFANVDVTRIGMSGHSFGAQSTLAVSGQKAGAFGGPPALDSRIMAAIAFSPNARNKFNVARQFGDIRIPFFSITGSEDGSILGDDTRPQDRTAPYQNMPAGDKYLVVFDRGDHMVFGGHDLGRRRPETARDREIQAAVKAASLAFWNATLKRDEAARKWLVSGGFKATLDGKDVFASK